MKKLRHKAILMVVVEILCLAVLGSFIMVNQTQVLASRQQTEISAKLAQMPALIQASEETESQLYKSYDDVYQAKADAAAYIIHNLDGYASGDLAMRDLAERLDVGNVLIVGTDGEVLAAAAQTQADFSRARFNRLYEVFSQKTPDTFGIEYPNGTRVYFSSLVDETRMAVIEEDPAELDVLVAQTTGWQSVLGNVSVGLGGFSFAVSDKDYTFLYHPDETLIGADALYAGIHAEDLEEGWYGHMTLQDERYYCGVTHLSGAYIVCAVSEAEIRSSRGLTMAVVLFIFFSVITAIITYAIMLLKAQRRGDRGEPNIKRIGFLSYDVSVGKRIAPIVMLGLLLIVGVTFYMQTVFSLSQQAISNSQREQEIESTIARYQIQAQEILSQYNTRYLNKAQTAAFIVSRMPDIDAAQLETLSDVLDVEWICVFDNYGAMYLSDSPYGRFRLSTNPEDQSYAFRKLLNGAPYVIQEALPDELSGDLRQYIGAAMKDADGEGIGFVQIAIEPSLLEQAFSATTIDSVLSGVTTGENGFAFSVDKQTHTFSYHPTQKLIGRDAMAYGLTDSALTDSFSDYITIDGVRCFATALETQDDFVFIALPAQELNQSRAASTVSTAVISLICLLVVFVLLTFSPVGHAPASPDAPQDKGSDIMLDVKMPDGQIKKTQSAASRWAHTSIAWASKSPEQQMLTVVRGLLAVMAVFICAAMCFGRNLFGENSIFVYILSGQWQRGLNIFAISACVLHLCVFVVVTMALRKILRLLSNALDARGETVCRLLHSFVQYVSVIAALYYCLALFGVDTQALLASAGILTLVIGLAAQSLVADIIAGLFLIFEGEFRVGDIVTVGGWRGTVTEIGVRTTKIEDGTKNVKVLSNREVTGVINMTRKYSMAVCDVGIEYGESLERVETILSKELPLIQKRLPAIQSGPFYKGVTALGDNSVNIRIVAECSERDRFQLVRDMNREVKLLFDRYDINIPFPQVVINQPPEFKQATASERQKADTFNRQQGELAKDIVDSAQQ